MSHDAGMVPWLDALAHALEHAGRAVLVVVAGVQGSVPRESGAAMVVTHDGLSGTIGGGHLEFEATRMAREALRDGQAATWLVRFPLAARVGQCCGGVATLVFAAIDATARPWLDAANACLRSGAPFALVGALGGSAVNTARLVVTADDTRGSLGDRDLDSAAIAFARTRLASAMTGATLMPVPGSTDHLVVHVTRPDPFPVLVFGNGHVGRALVRVLSVLPMQVRWVDEREDDFPREALANVEVVVTDVPEAEIRVAPPRAAVVVTTHSHALDFALVEAALDRDDWRYVGMIGSRAKRAQLERRLAARGVAPERLRRVTCPIGAGLPGLDGKAPGVIAVAVAAELLALREVSTAARLPLAQPAR